MKRKRDAQAKTPAATDSQRQLPIRPGRSRFVKAAPDAKEGSVGGHFTD